MVHVPCPGKSAENKITVNPVSRKPYKQAARRQKSVLYGEKKRHTLKTQVIIERDNLEIIDVQEVKGREHDFKVYKDPRGTDIGNSIPLDADPGIEAYHANSFIQVKASKKHHLSEGEKAYTKELAVRCVVIDHSNAKIKTFRCMSYPYRGHYHNRHSLRMTLIYGLINYDRMV